MAVSTIARAVATSTSLPNGLQPRPIAETRRPEAPSFGNCTADDWQDFSAEASARFDERLRRCIAAVADDDHVIQAKADHRDQPLSHVLRGTDDAEAVHEVVGERRFVRCATGGV